MKEKIKNIFDTFQDALLTLYPKGEIRQITYLLFEAYMGKSKTNVHLSYEEVVPHEISEKFADALELLKKGCPIQYVLHKAWFNGMELTINPGVLIPRQETEELCNLVKAEQVHRQNESLEILDIGTGSGCIAIDLKKFFPLSRLTGIDISSNVISLARENAQRMNTKIQFVEVDIFSRPETNKLGRFDIIVSNPPYVLENEKPAMNRNVIDFEPSEALFVPIDDPLKFYIEIARFAQVHLTIPGFLYVEINEHFGDLTKQLFQTFGFRKVKVIMDIHGKDRMVRAEWTGVQE